MLLAIGRGLRDRVRFQTPDEHSYTRNVVELRKMPRANASDIHDVGNFFKSAAQIVECIAVSHINRTAAVKAEVIDVLCETQQSVELERSPRPARNGSGQVLKNGYRALAPAEPHRVRDLAPRNQNSFPRQRPRLLYRARFSNVEQRRESHQIADVGNHPVLAGFHKPVLVELGNVSVHDVDLLGNHLQQGAQRIAAIRITQAVDRREQFVKSIRVWAAHVVISVKIRVSGISGVRMTSSAGLIRFAGST